MKQAKLAIVLGSALALQACSGTRPSSSAEPLQPTGNSRQTPVEPLAHAAPPEPQPAAAKAPELTPAPPQNHVQVAIAANPPVPTAADTRPAPSPIIAKVGTEPITRDQLMKPLIEGYGLNMLLNIVQLEYVKQVAKSEKIQVSAADIERERELTFAKLFKDAEKAQYPQLYAQLLEQQHVSRAEFELVLETNAYLRKIAEPQIAGAINDQALEEGFRQLYGETVQIRHIELGNLQDVGEAKRRLAAGEPFAKVAKEMSRNPQTASMGGELPPFSRTAGYPQSLKDAAFNLKQDEVSDPILIGTSYHLIKLEQRIAPKAVKFEDVKASIREELLDRGVQARIQDLRTQFAQDAVRILTVEDPILKQQYDDKLKQRDQQIQNRNEIREQWERERQRILDRAATQPSATQPGVPQEMITPSTAPSAPASEVAQPPATGSGVAVPGTPD